MSKGLSSIALYGNTNKLAFSISSLCEEFKVSEAGTPEQGIQQSESFPSWHQGEDWEEVEGTGGSRAGGVKADSQILVGSGLGSIPTTSYSKLKGKERWVLVQKEVQAGVKEERASQMVGRTEATGSMD